METKNQSEETTTADTTTTADAGPSDAGTQSFVDKREGDFWVNALIGAVVTVLTSFVGVSPVIGGAASGFLQGESRMSGAKVGAVSGLIASVPAFLGILLFFGIGVVGSLAGGDAAGGAIVIGLIVVFFAAIAAFSGGLGAIGGYVGALVAEDN